MGLRRQDYFKCLRLSENLTSSISFERPFFTPKRIKFCIPVIQAHQTRPFPKGYYNNSNQFNVSKPFPKNAFLFTFQGNEIFGSLSAGDYNRIIKLIEQAIIATDLALYFQ